MSRGVVMKGQQTEIAQKIAPTTVFDYLYRARIKSNYEDPTMYHQGTIHTEAMLDLVRSTQQLATALCGLLATIVWHSADKAARDELRGVIDTEELTVALEGSDR